MLRQVYAGLYGRIRAELACLPGLTIELGSGIGQIKTVIPEAVTTDIFANPWLDRVEDAYALSFGPGSVGNLILFDVFHHLEFPGSALQEFARVVQAGGRLILMEPGFGLLGALVYRFLHHEAVGFGQPITWMAPEGAVIPQRYYAAQGNAWRLFVSGERSPNLLEWRVRRVTKVAALSYLLSGGFSKPALVPHGWWPALAALDRAAGVLPALFTTRLLVVLERVDV